MPLSPNAYFTQQLLRWNKHLNHRSMPWKGEKNAYKIWLSEIILQQTRVEQGLSYYKKFIKEFPDVHALAHAPETLVMKLWEGLGYYSRCRNLLKTARLVVDSHGGVFPVDYDVLLKLPGVGPYTAAAISSFATNAPHAVVDGNVIRILARFWGIHEAPGTITGKKTFEELARKMLPPRKAALYNQAIMDFGATVCKPAAPLCDSCVLKRNCYAFNHHAVSSLPVRMKRPEKKDRYFHFIYIRYRGRVCVIKRQQKDIWQGLFQFPAKETRSTQQPTDFFPFVQSSAVERMDTEYTQILTHQKIHAQFYKVTVSAKPEIPESVWVQEKALHEYPMPKVLVHFLKNIHK